MSIECRIFDYDYITENPSNWDYAYSEPYGCTLGENEWFTDCSARVTFIGTLDTFGSSWYGGTPGHGYTPCMGVGGSDLRWGHMRLQDGEYIFYPWGDSVPDWVGNKKAN